jgi:two-component system NtrC family sensor kinase
MFTERWRRLTPPQSLRRQFILALSVLALLIVAGGLTAVYALRLSTESTRQLAGERLQHMQEAQDLVLRTLLIERESNRMTGADSPAALREGYAGITQQLELLDQLVQRLVTGSDDVSVLALHQSAQLFRNTANVVASLLESALQAEADAGQARAPGRPAQADTLRHFRDELQRQVSAMTGAAQALSAHFTEDYRATVKQLTDTSQRNQRWVLALLVSSLLLAWLGSKYFLGQHVLGRLQQVSHYLRLGDTASAQPRVPVTGSDEIGQMARAVELFMADRQQLATANQALEAERARQEELIKKLAQTQSQLLQSEKMAAIGQLAAGVAHEINNPIGFVMSNLGSLRGYAEDLLKLLAAFEAGEGELTADTRAALANLKQQIDLGFLREDVAVLLSESMDGLQRVKRIVQDLKDFSHVDESGKQWANLEQGLDSTLNVAWSELKYKAEVVKAYAGIPEIECMPSELNQVFMNLMVNAAHAIKDRGTITLRTGREDDQVWVEVQDSGAGIKPEHLGRIFDPFFTTKPVGQGTGLGLSLSYGIVQKHGGHINVQSEVGVGSVFRVSLPIHAHGANDQAH